MRMGLSYLKIVVIAVVLGMMARTFGPQSGRAGVEDKTTRLIEMLVSMRTGIDIYRAEHEGKLPSTNSSEHFVNAMTQSDGHFGPYINDVPENPFNGLDEVRFDGEPAGANKAGWRLDTETGAFQADNGFGYSDL